MVESNVVHDSDCSTVLTLIIVPFASLCRALMCWKGVPESAGSFKYRLGFAGYLSEMTTFSLTILGMYIDIENEGCSILIVLLG